MKAVTFFKYIYKLCTNVYCLKSQYDAPKIFDFLLLLYNIVTSFTKSSDNSLFFTRGKRPD